jgi:hypothetical protein
VTPEGVNHLPDAIKWAKSTYFSWTHDHKGFFYSRYPSVDGVDDLGTGAGSFHWIARRRYSLAASSAHAAAARVVQPNGS